MSIMLLRKLTKKSIIGFGKYKELTVQDIIQLKDHKYLLWLYYFNSIIDFCEELKNELFITHERVILKPGKDESMYGCFYRNILNDIITFEEKIGIQNIHNNWFRARLKKANKKNTIVRNHITEARFNSKILNRKNNQWK